MIDDRLDQLVRARVAATKRRPKPEAVAKAIAPFAPDTVSAGDLRDRVVRSLARVDQAAPADWKTLVEQTVPGEILGVDRITFTAKDAWAAAIVGRRLGLWTEGPPPKLAALCDALVWHELGLAGTPKTCPDEVRALFVQRRIGSAAAGAKADRQLRVLAARDVRAARAEAKLLRNGLVRMWLEGGRLGTAFVDDLRGVVQTTTRGVFGDRKVFIAAAWRELAAKPAWSALALDDFKARVLAAHRAGDVELARADLIGAMDPELVHASETTAAGVRFHFLVREMS